MLIYAVKFQNYTANSLVSDKGFKLQEKIQNSTHQANWKKSVYETYNDASVPIDWTPHLKEHCDKIGIDFFTTPYDLKIVEYIKSSEFHSSK